MTRASNLFTCALAWTTAAVLMGAPASAVEDDNLADLLEEKGLISAEERESIREDAASEDEPTVPRSEPDDGDESDEKVQQVELSVGAKGLSITSPDKRFQFAFGGRIQFDAGGFIQDKTSLGDGAELRRARIKSHGYVYDDWQYKLEVNFDTDSDVSITDSWLRYNGFKPFTVTLGHQKVPFSQQSMTSSNWQVFQERALLDAFIDTGENGRRRLGGVLGSHGDHWNLQLGVFAEGVATSGSEDEDFGTAARAVWAPIAEDKRFLIFGGAIYYRDFNSPSELKFATTPEAHMADTDLVDTGQMTGVDDELLFNFDASVVWGPFHAQAEYTGAKVYQGGAANPYFYGYYAQAGWFITGESRNFDIKSGKYKRPKPTREGIGAWEVAVRWSYIDLQDKDILGGKERNFTAGLNWWVNQNVMFRFNYVYGMARPNSEITGLGGLDEDIHAFIARAQIVF
jgi:phosphate-selective porin OprO/OprP